MANHHPKHTKGMQGNIQNPFNHNDFEFSANRIVDCLLEESKDDAETTSTSKGSKSFDSCCPNLCPSIPEFNLITSNLSILGSPALKSQSEELQSAQSFILPMLLGTYTQNSKSSE